MDRLNTDFSTSGRRVVSMKKKKKMRCHEPNRRYCGESKTLIFCHIKYCNLLVTTQACREQHLLAVLHGSVHRRLQVGDKIKLPVKKVLHLQQLLFRVKRIRKPRNIARLDKPDLILF